MKLIIVLGLILIVLCMILKTTSKKKAVTGDWVVYGSMGCGWTRKQLQELDSKGVQYTFIDCSKENCQGIDAFPTLKSLVDNKIHVGYVQF